MVQSGPLYSMLSFLRMVTCYVTKMQYQNKDIDISTRCVTVLCLTTCVDSGNHHWNQDTELHYNHKNLPHTIPLESHLPSPP